MKSSRKESIWLLIGCCVLAGSVLLGCGSKTQRELNNSDPLSPPAAVFSTDGLSHSQLRVPGEELRDWLRRIPCQPPCWEGITPGQTTVPQALAILRELSFVNNLQSYDAVSSIQSNEGTADWTWRDHTSSGGSVSYYLDSTVYRLTVDYPSRLTLQEVLDAYGEPSHVYAGAYPSTDRTHTIYRLDVLYVPQGFALELEGDNSVRPSDFGAGWSNFYLLFFEPSVQGFATAWGNPGVAEELIPWRGVLSFADYCTGEGCDKTP
jgi:hypothetical protein